MTSNINLHLGQTRFYCQPFTEGKAFHVWYPTEGVMCSQLIITMKKLIDSREERIHVCV